MTAMSVVDAELLIRRSARLAFDEEPHWAERVKQAAQKSKMSKKQADLLVEGMDKHKKQALDADDLYDRACTHVTTRTRAKEVLETGAAKQVPGGVQGELDEAQLDELLGRVKAYEADFQRLQEDEKEAEKDLINAVKVEEENEKRSKEIERDLQEAQEAERKVEQDLKQQAEDLRNAEREGQQLTNESRDLQQVLKTEKLAKGQLEAEHRALGNALQRSELEKQLVEEEIRNDQAESEELAQAIGRLEEKVGQKEATLKENEAEIDNMANKIRKSERAQFDFERDIKQLDQEIGQETKQWKELEEEIRGEEVKAAQLEKDAAELATTNAEGWGTVAGSTAAAAATGVAGMVAAGVLTGGIGALIGGALGVAGACGAGVGKAVSDGRKKQAAAKRAEAQVKRDKIVRLKQQMDALRISCEDKKKTRNSQASELQRAKEECADFKSKRQSAEKDRKTNRTELDALQVDVHSKVTQKTTLDVTIKMKHASKKEIKKCIGDVENKVKKSEEKIRSVGERISVHEAKLRTNVEEVKALKDQAKALSEKCLELNARHKDKKFLLDRVKDKAVEAAGITAAARQRKQAMMQVMKDAEEETAKARADVKRARTEAVKQQATQQKKRPDCEYAY